MTASVEDRTTVSPDSVSPIALDITAFALLIRPALLVLASLFAAVSGLPNAWMLAFVNLLCIGVGLWSLPHIFRTAPKTAWIATWTVLLMFIVSMLFYQGGLSLIGAFGVELILGLIWLVVMSSIRSFERFSRLLYAGGFVILAATGLQLFLNTASRENAVGYSQFVAYLALPAALIFVHATFVRRPFLNAALALIAATMVLSTGARGPLVIIVIYVMVVGALKVRRTPYLSFLIVGGGIVATVWLQTNAGRLLGALSELLQSLGLSTRVVNRLLEGSLLEDRARGTLVTETLHLIEEHPWLGVGMGNERRALSSIMGRTEIESWAGWYPHNVILEILVQYGVLLGSAAMVFITYLVLVTLRGKFYEPSRQVAFIFIGFGLLPLLFSGSYLNWPQFFAFIGVGLAIKASKRVSAPQIGPVDAQPS